MGFLRALSLAALCGSLSACATYKFGVDKREHAYAFVNGTGKSGNPQSESWVLLPRETGPETLYIEHLAPVVQYDRQIIDSLDSDRYLFFGTTLLDPASIRGLRVHTYYDGRLLEEWGSYVNRTEGAMRKETLVECSTDSLSEALPFSAFKIYRFPVSKWRVWLLPRAFWFGGPVRQTVVIDRRDGRQDSLTFTLRWFKEYTTLENFDAWMMSY